MCFKNDYSINNKTISTCLYLRSFIMLSNYSQKWGLSLIIVDILPFYLCDNTLWIKRIRKKRLGCYWSLEVLEEQSLSVGIRKLMTHLTSSNSKCKAESALRMMQVLEILQFPPLIEFLQSFICEYTFPGKSLIKTGQTC